MSVIIRKGVGVQSPSSALSNLQEPTPVFPSPSRHESAVCDAGVGRPHSGAVDQEGLLAPTTTVLLEAPGYYW